MKPLNRKFLANGSQNIAILANYMWLKSATGEVFIETSEGETASLKSGDFIRFSKTFKNFTCTDLSGSENDLTFNLSVNGDAGSFGVVQLAKANKFLDVADVQSVSNTATLLLAANSERKEIFITSLGSNSNESRIGSADISATRGTPLAVGGTAIIETGAAIYVFNSGSDDFAISFSEY
jgi:hypothetical protein